MPTACSSSVRLPWMVSANVAPALFGSENPPVQSMGKQKQLAGGALLASRFSTNAAGFENPPAPARVRDGRGRRKAKFPQFRFCLRAWAGSPTNRECQTSSHLFLEADFLSVYRHIIL